MAHSVRITKLAERQFKKFTPSVQRQLFDVFDKLQTDPFLLDIKKLKTPFEGYRVRSGQYRILLVVEKKVVKIYSIKHRKDAYRI